jgi:hypothetical protein
MDEEISLTLESLNSRGLKAVYAEDRAEAREVILGLVPLNATVGTGDSTTIRQLEILDALRARGTEVFNSYQRDRSFTRAERREIGRGIRSSDVFMTGTNAVTTDGRLVNVDGMGNRVAGMFYSHKMSILVVGRNKITKNLDEAFYRVRKIISPNHLRIRGVELGGVRFDNPCVATGVCTDCRLPHDRRCNIFTIIEGKPGGRSAGTEIHVVMVNKDLGLGWDESWPNERISKIIDEYKKYVWVPPPRLDSRA